MALLLAESVTSGPCLAPNFISLCTRLLEVSCASERKGGQGRLARIHSLMCLVSR